MPQIIQSELIFFTDKCFIVYLKSILPVTASVINEDLYDVDAHSAFSQLCEMTTGISGLRLDLFIDEAKGDA